MKTLKSAILSLAFAAFAIPASAANLWIIGDATPCGWSTDDATALLSTAAAPEVYTGTIYLKADADFKFMTRPDFGNDEYGAAPGASLLDGAVALAQGTGDSGYDKLRVAESANYLITVDTDKMVATVVKSAYQDTEISLCSLFLVGNATAGGWSVDAGTPLYQNAERPYEYSAAKLPLGEGTFKIATVIKGGGTFDSKYFYFRDADDSGRIALGQDGDLQWNIDTPADYNIAVNTLAGTIDIAKATETGIADITSDSADAPAEYYTLDGLRVARPLPGAIYICRRGACTTKILF